MKKFIHYIAYLVPLIFAAACLALFCRIYNPCSESIQKADYAATGQLKVIQVEMLQKSK